MTRFRTAQEAFWAGEFGDAYTARNTGDAWIASNTAFFARVLRATRGIGSVLELGANIGLNLHALRAVLPAAELTGVEINASAARALREIPGVDVIEGSILELEPTRTWDLVLTKGVLIHVHPDELARVYEVIHRASSRYVCVAEYYAPSPVSIPYRGHEDRLFKRDFAGELLDGFPDLALVDYGFAWRRDPVFPQDDLTWFLLEKR
jgi:spore coat polysaccharide biosynthesis protein SpsF